MVTEFSIASVSSDHFAEACLEVIIAPVIVALGLSQITFLTTVSLRLVIPYEMACVVNKSIVWMY